MRRCPICGNDYADPPAISRKDNRTEICPKCGMSEAFEAIGTAMHQKTEIYTAYSQEADITFIMEDKGKTTSVVGFYYGEPDESATAQYYGKLKAEFE